MKARLASHVIDLKEEKQFVGPIRDKVAVTNPYIHLYNLFVTMDITFPSCENHTTVPPKYDLHFLSSCDSVLSWFLYEAWS